MHTTLIKSVLLKPLIVGLCLLSHSVAFAKDEQAIKRFIQNHCAKCHGEEKQKGSMRLDQLDAELKESAAVTAWQDVLDVLNTGEMPPEDETQPSSNDLTLVIGAITANIQSAHKRLAATGGVIKMRHLTKREYFGSMKDLFDIDLPQNAVPDDVSDDFDTIGANQFFSLKQFDNFYKAARDVVQKNLRAYAAPAPKPDTIRHDPEIAPAKAAKAAYEQMVKTKELIEAGAPFSEISKVNPKVAEEGQARLFIKRYPIRSKKPIANYEKTRGKKGVSAGFSFATEARPLSSYTVAIGALDAAGGSVDISVNGQSVGSVQLKPGKDQISSELTFRAGIFDSTVNIKVSGGKNDVYDYLTLSGPFEDASSEPSFFESVVKPIAQRKDVGNQEIASMLKRFAGRAFRYQGVDDEFIAELAKVYKSERSTGNGVAESLVEP